MTTADVNLHAIDARRALKRSTLALSLALVLFSFAFVATGCKDSDETIRHGEGQKETAEEREKQNRRLIEQVVEVAENQDKNPDSTYLSGALTRLDTWIETAPVSPDFVEDSEFDQMSKDFEALAETAKKADALARLFVDDAQSPKEQDCDELQKTLETAKAQIAPLAKTLRSNALSAYGLFVDDFIEKLSGAREFQFVDPTEAFQNNIRQFAQTPSYQFYNFASLREGASEFARFLRIGDRKYLSEDADFLRSKVWSRNAFTWAKGGKQDDLEIVKRLFDWSVKNVVLTDRAMGPAGPIDQLQWHTLLLSQGDALDRAIVFIELLRQHRLDAFVLRPANPSEEAEKDFPVVVGVRLNGETYLFAPEYGLPFASNEEGSVTNEGGLDVKKIATLAEVARDDSILRKFDLDDAPFPATSKDFEETIAYVVSTPCDVAERMFPLEQEFSGVVNTVLTTPYGPQCERIKELAGIVDVRRLHEANAPILEHAFFPFESEALVRVYMTQIQSSVNLEVEANTDKVSSGKETDMADYEDATNFSGSQIGHSAVAVSPLWSGKINYLRGRFTDENGAAPKFLQCRFSNRALKQLESDVKQVAIGTMEKYANEKASRGETATDDELRQVGADALLAAQLEVATKRYIKIVSSFYLALLSEESGNTSAAIERLNDESLRPSAGANTRGLGDEFRNAANYLRARILETQGNTAAAIARLKENAEIGPRVRAKWLEKFVPTAANGEAQTQPEPADEAQPATEGEAQTQPETAGDVQPATEGEAQTQSEPADDVQPTTEEATPAEASDSNV